MGLRLRGEAWYLRKNVDGRRQEIPLGVYGGEANRAKAEAAAEKVTATLNDAKVTAGVMRRFGIEAPKPVEPKADSGITFADWWTTYKASYEPQKAESTQERDEHMIQHWLPILGAMKMTDIKQMDCIRGLNIRRKARAANPGRKAPTTITESTVQRERRFLHAIFERAIENNIIEANPWRGKGIKKVADPTRSDRVLSEADEVKLVGVLGDPFNPRWVRFIRFLLETGLRLDELLNTHFRDMGAYVSVRGKGSKQRDVALTTLARKTLDDQWADPDRPADKKMHPWWQHEQRFRGVLAEACVRAKIPHLSPHDLRHTFGHRFLQRGGDIYVLSKILGHASVIVTSKHYAFMRRDDVGARMLAVMEPVIRIDCPTCGPAGSTQPTSTCPTCNGSATVPARMRLVS